MSSCECDPLSPPAPVVDNPPGQPALRWRVSPHGAAVGRVRAALAGDAQPAVRALARHGTDEPAVALIDAWAVVADIVSFYTERIADEGFLRTATELRSVRELARTLGYELRPGVAAGVELAFTVEDVPGGPAQVLVPAGTPVQTVPAQGQLPQTFETSEDLLTRPPWNAIPGAPAQKQEIRPGKSVIWLRGSGLGVRDGDSLVLVLGPDRLAAVAPAAEQRAAARTGRWDLLTVAAATENPEGLIGWTRLQVRSQGSWPVRSGGVGPDDSVLLAFAERADAFGWNAPDPTFIPGSGVPPGSDWTDLQIGATPGHEGTVELDGDHPRVEAGSSIVLRSPTASELYRVTAVAPGGAVLHGLSGRITRISVVPEGAAPHDLTAFSRRETVVLCQSRVLPTGEAPRRAAAGGRDLDLAVTDPPLPPGRRVLVVGSPPRREPTDDGTAGSQGPVCEPATVFSTATGTTDPALMRVTFEHPLSAGIDPQTLRVLGNVAEATHGETVQQVLGSGDGRVPFAEFRPARGPLTYVRDTTPSGARSTLQLRVDGVAWTEVASLDTVAAHDRVFIVHADEKGAVRLVLGDGTRGARATTGTENVAATYRVGIGDPGDAAVGQLTMLTRRPLGIRAVTNPAPARNWAPPETLDDARRNAPLRIRTLDRAVSVADHGDFATAFAGVGTARADEVRDGQAGIVVVSLLGTAGTPVSADLRADLGTALAAARDPGTPLRLLGGELRWYGIRVELRIDPAYSRPAVEQAVRDALATQLGPAAGAFAAPVTAAGVLVRVRAVAGVVACTMPRLLPLPGWSPQVPGIAPQLPDDTAAAAVLAALPARFEAGAVLSAQVLALAPGGVAIGVMGP